MRKNIYLLGLLVLGVLYTQNLKAQDCKSGDCQNGAGVMIMEDGSRYIGQFKNGFMNGTGTMRYTDGTMYQGQWQEGQPQGNGKKYFEDGTVIAGFWEAGRLAKTSEDEFIGKGNNNFSNQQTSGCISGDCVNGEGVYVLKSGSIYIGSFQKGEIHGVGVCMYPDGSKYKGEWSHRYPEGNGTMTYADGTVRSGMWKKGRPVSSTGTILNRSAETTYSIDDGSNVQSGCISGDCIDGSGIMAFAEGSRYEGEFRNSKFNGQGAMFYADGSNYRGGFKNGTRHGQGTFTDQRGKAQAGKWSYGSFVGNTSIGPNLKGCIDGNCIDGYGTFLFPKGDKYTGTFKEGKPDGYGKVAYSNGERYEGQMQNGAFHGVGTLYRSSGAVKGVWRQGMLIKMAGEREVMVSENNNTNAPSSTSSRAKQPQIYAVIVGIAAYDHMPTLNYTDDDAYRFFAFLKSPEGGALSDDRIKILIDEDATKKNILTTANKVFSQASADDVVIFYFSGHGLRGSFLPIDYDGYNNKLFHSEVKALLENCDAKLKLCIADACHSGSLLALRGNVDSQLEDYYNRLAESKPGTVLIMSSKSNETSLESSGLRQGVFSHFLIRGLKGEADKDQDSFIGVSELFNYIEYNVRTYTRNRQFPIMKGEYDPNTPLAKKI